MPFPKYSLNIPVTTTNIHAPSISLLSKLPTSPIRFSRGVFSFFTVATCLAIFPNSVFDPVAMTTVFPLPSVTVVPAKTMLFISATWISFSMIFVCFSTGSDSPVRDASLTCSRNSSIILPSAGTLSPDSSITMSPGTTSLAKISLSSEFRKTRATGLSIFFKASIAFSALYSWVKPNNAAAITIANIVMASMTSPTNIDRTAAAKSIITNILVNCPARILNGEIFLGFSSSFNPYFFNRSLDSSSVKPLILDLVFLSASSTFMLCQFSDKFTLPP